MSASLSGVWNEQNFSDAGALLVGGRLYTRVFGTTTHKIAYVDKAGTISHTYTLDSGGDSYIALNARGELPAPLYFTAGSYDLALKRSDGSTVWTRRADPIDDGAVALAASSGAALVGGGDQVVNSIAALRLLLKTSASKYAFVTGYYAASDGGGGNYWYDSSDTTSADNGGTIIVAADGGRWKLAETDNFSLNQFGLGGTAAQNVTAAQVALTAGGAYTVNVGTYPFSASLSSSYTGAPSLGSSATKRYDIAGMSRNNTVFTYSGTGYWLNASGGASGHALQAFDRLSNFQLQGVGGANYGINYSLKVASEISNVYIAGFLEGLRLDGIFTAKIDNLKIAACASGAVLDGTQGLGSPNLVHFNRCNFEACTTAGVNGVQVGDNVVLNAVDVEGCGTTGSATTGGIILNLLGSNGPGPLVISNSYLELNKGGFDIYIENKQNTNAVVIIDGCFFNRAHVTDHTTNNIVLRNTGTGTLRVILRGSAFFHTGSYVPSAAEPYFNIGTGCELIDGGGNSYSSNTPLPNGPTSRPGITSEIFCGDITDTGGINFAPNGVTVNKTGTGTYNIVHSLGWGADVNAYFPSAISSSAANNKFVHRVLKVTNTTFTVFTTDVAATAVDCPFYFQVAKNA